MKFHNRTKRYLIFILSFLMAFEPFAVEMVRAAEAEDMAQVVAEVEGPVVEHLDTDGIDGIIDIEEVEKPVDYLEYMLSLRGRSRSDDSITANNIDEAVAWGEWMNTISGAYTQMDDGCTDVFSFYNALGEVQTQLSQAPDYLTMVCFAANKATLAVAFVAKSIPGLTNLTSKASKAVSNANKWLKSKSNLFVGLEKMGKAFGNAAKTANTFISHMCPPVGFKAGCEVGEGFVSYLRWVARKTGADGNAKYKETIKKINEHLSKDNQICTNKGAKVISDTKGIAHTVGIGLTIIGIAMDSYDIITSEDRQGGRYATYGLVKSYVSLALGVASLVAMFCIPVVGQVLGVIAIVWMCLTYVFDQFGDYNKQWKEAYKNSYWYLYTQDPEFKSYYDNRTLLNEEEKSAAYLVTEKNYGAYKDMAYEFLANNKNENSYYDDKSQEAISSRVFIELEKQGVLSSYYNRSVFKLPDYSLSRLMELWQMKADYMAWKPTEEESVRAENRGFWGKVGHALNPMTYVSWAGNKINEIKYDKNVERYNIEKVFCCPDYCLQKKYQSWITANRKMNGTANDAFYQTIGLRIEQSPWNYIPLVGIDTMAWSDDLLMQAFNADAFFVGVKEMMYFKAVIEESTKKVKEVTKQTTKTVETLKDSVEFFTYRAEALQAIRDGYRNTPDNESKGKDIMKSKAVKKAFGWKWNKDNGAQTPRNIVKIYWSDISQCLTYDALSVSQKGAECTLLVDTIKHNLDTATMMQQLLKEKRDALANFDSDFTNEDFNKYLKKGSFLDVKGSTFMDWLSELHPAYDEMEFYCNHYEDAAEDFQKAADDSNEGHKKHIFGITTSNSEYHPNYVIGELNDVIRMYKNVAEDYEDIANDLALDGLVISSADDKVYTEYAQREITALDPDKDISSVVIPEGDND